MYSYGPPHMAEQKQDDQLEHTYSSYVRIWDVALKTCQRWWMIERNGERGLGISVLVARHDDDDDDELGVNKKKKTILILKWLDLVLNDLKTTNQRNCYCCNDTLPKHKSLVLLTDTVFFNTAAGLLQEDTAAPYLFILCLDYILQTSIAGVFVV